MKVCRSTVLVALLSAGLAVPAAHGRGGAAPGQGPEMELEPVLATALESSPELRRAEAAVAEARAGVVAARTVPYNPTLDLEAADRSGPDGSTTDRGLALSQRIELAGKRGKRLAAARAAVAEAEARYERRRREVLAAAERSFAEAVRARELMAVAKADVALTESLLTFEERRLEAGAGTRIDVNLARAAAGRAVRRLRGAEAAWWEHRSRLAEAIGLDPAAPPRPVGALPAAAAPVPALEELTRRALSRRADLAAAGHEHRRGERQVAIERSAAVPDLELGIFAAREEGDDISGVRLGFAIPLFNRNPGAIARAEASVDRLTAEVASAELTVRREVATAHSRYRRAAEAVAALDGFVVETLEESLDLLRKAVEAGELSARDVLLLRRELIEGRREQIEMAGELWLARTELELAGGGDLAPFALEGGDR